MNLEAFRSRLVIAGDHIINPSRRNFVRAPSLAIDSGESPAKAKDFFAANHLSLPVLVDFTGSTSDKYGVSAIPSTFFIDGSGVIRQKWVGAFPSAKAIEAQLRTIMP